MTTFDEQYSKQNSILTERGIRRTSRPWHKGYSRNSHIGCVWDTKCVLYASRFGSPGCVWCNSSLSLLGCSSSQSVGRGTICKFSTRGISDHNI